ncbi:hypothetical protein [Hymenobacter properus]|uniref:Uncharacterized protein n=1 Tax=Hymenobacter properus TaxID=2791026 RepID=A0A931BJ48_9BACT|nr:hypothetical protein [Hymenobacter properus]MBF9143237.1 hypothetical protein [Hymenobacter properus]MBR7722047.1 hypothetical protein [Microvirga sp. SRT04]
MRHSTARALACGLLGALRFGPAAAQKPAQGPAPGHGVSAYQAACTLPPRLSALDSANGFHGFAFGTRLVDWPAPLAGLGLRAARGGQLTAWLPGEPVVIGGLILRGLRLGFCDGRLARLTFAPTSEAYAPEMLRVLRALYGPEQPAGFGRVQWRGQRVTLVYELLFAPTGRARGSGTPEQGQVSLLGNAWQPDAPEPPRTDR